MSSDPPDVDVLRHAHDVRSRDLVEARVGLAQAVAALTNELGAQRRHADSAQIEIAALREHVERDRAVIAELTARLDRAQRDVERLRRSKAIRYRAQARRLIGRLTSRE